MGTVNLVLVLLTVLVTTVAQVVMKLGTDQSQRRLDPAADLMLRLWSIYATPLVLLGLLLYGVATVLYLRVLSEVHLSQVYPMVALSYLFTMAAGILWLGEPVVGTRIAGAALVLAGVGLISWR